MTSPGSQKCGWQRCRVDGSSEDAFARALAARPARDGGGQYTNTASTTQGKHSLEAAVETQCNKKVMFEQG